MEQLAFVFDMNTLFEEFVAEFLRRHKDKIEIGRRTAAGEGRATSAASESSSASST